MDVSILARDIVKELLEREREVGRTAPGQGISPWGGQKYLLSEGLIALPVKGSQSQLVLQRTSAEPRAWVVTMAGVIQEGPAPGTNAYPFAKFVVTWGSSGANYSTEVDGFSDQFLTVWGNQVTVSCEWDFDAFNAFSGGVIAFPARMLLRASIGPSDGAVTKAWRTFPNITDAAPKAFAVNIPYGAIGVIVRQPTAVPVAVTLGFFSQSGGVGVETYSAASVAAAHDSGGYLSVPSMADRMAVGMAAFAPPKFVFAEFLVEP